MVEAIAANTPTMVAREGVIGRVSSDARLERRLRPVHNRSTRSFRSLFPRSGCWIMGRKDATGPALGSASICSRKPSMARICSVRSSGDSLFSIWCDQFSLTVSRHESFLAIRAGSDYVLHLCQDRVWASPEYQYWRNAMSWNTPRVVEISVGMEINCYACAEI